MITPSPDYDFTLRVLRNFDMFADGEKSYLMWRTDAEYAPVTFFIDCSDVFAWGGTDCATLTPGNIDAFEQAVADLKAIGDCSEVYANLLFCARLRGMRPQGAIYKGLSDGFVRLLDECGPPRDVGIGNPYPHPSVLRARAALRMAKELEE